MTSCSFAKASVVGGYLSAVSFEREAALRSIEPHGSAERQASASAALTQT